MADLPQVRGQQRTEAPLPEEETVSVRVPLVETARQKEETAPDEEIVEMNPFVVSTSRDVGYLAQNSVSGSRMNSKLSELAAPTSVFTREFFEDMAITNFNELMDYAVGTQDDYQIGALASDSGGDVPDDARRTRVRGLSGNSPSVNFFTSSIPLSIDTFSIERAEQSRGPNAILFGLGSPGGMINASTKRASLSRSFGRADVKITSHNGLRTALDLNEPLSKHRLALRVAGVKVNNDTWRRHEWDDEKRLYAALRWQVAKATQLNVEYERGLINKAIARAWVADDAYTPWIDAGRQPWVPGEWVGKGVGAGVTNPLGLAGISSYDHYVVDTATGEVRNWKGLVSSRMNTDEIENRNVAITDFGLLPREANLAGVAFPQKTDYTRASFFLTHSFARNLNLELAGNYSEVRRDIMAMGGGRARAISWDPNMHLDETGTRDDPPSNPGYGKTYLEWTPIKTGQGSRDRSLRLSLAYDKNLGRIFGTQALALMWEGGWSTARATSQVQLIQRADTSVPTTYPDQPEHAENWIWYRTYVDLARPVETIAADDWRGIDLGVVTAADGTAFSVSRWINRTYVRSNYYYDRYRQNAGMAVLQSRWLASHLLTVVGYRRDREDTWYSPKAERDPTPVPGYTAGEYIVKRGEVNTPTKAETLTASAVLRVTNWLGLTYNYSSNLTRPARGLTYLSDRGTEVAPPAPEGVSHDLGVKLDFRERLYLALTYYKTAARRDFERWRSTSPLQLINTAAETGGASIWGALDGMGVIAPDGRPCREHFISADGRTMDSEAEGIELEFIANPAPNWRVRFGFSDNKVIQKNIGHEILAYMDRYRDFWLDGDNGRVRLDGSGLAPVADDGSTPASAANMTVAQAVRVTDERVRAETTLFEGQMPRGQVRRRFVLTNSYSFRRGLLRGMSAGGSMRYQSAAVTAYDPVTQELLYGRPVMLVDLFVNYGGRAAWLAKNARWSLQANVRNLFDSKEMIPVRMSQDGRIQNYALQVPRELSLSCVFQY